MSKSTYRSFRDLKRILTKRNPHLMMDGNPLSLSDSRRLITAYLLFTSLLDDCTIRVNEWFDQHEEAQDLPQLLVSREMFRRDNSTKNVARHILAVIDSDAALIQEQLKNMLLFVRHISDNDMGIRHPFVSNLYKREMKDLRYGSTKFGVDWTNPICKVMLPYVRLLYHYESPILFGVCNDLLQFTTRLTLRDVDWIEEENVADYVSFEEELHNQIYDSSLLDDLRSIITDWFSDFTFVGSRTNHGYGATAEVRRSAGTEAKYHEMVLTQETTRFLTNVGWTPVDGIWPALSETINAYKGNDWDEDDVYHPLPAFSSRELITKVQLVPKGINKKRVVSMEPTVHQFCEKQIGDAFDRHFRKHPEMHIDLHDQTHNTALCLEGSSTGLYGTIDLSSASDSVTNTLVREVFRDTRIASILNDIRTRNAVLPDGQIVELEKYAPMGSATCFPIECTVFSAIVTLAQQRLGVHRYYRVYGDDLVVHKDVFDEVVRLLDALHFRVNGDKSYSPGSHFTESCGIECYFGTDVSPIRISRKLDTDGLEKSRSYDYNRKKGGTSRKINFRKRTKSPGLDGWYELANGLLKHRCYDTRKLVIEYTKDYFPGCIFSHSEERGFLCFSRNIEYVKRKWDRKLQRYVVLVQDTIASVDAGSDIARYSKLLEAYDLTSRDSLIDPNDRIDISAGAAHTVFGWKWVPWDDLVEFDSQSLSYVPNDGELLLHVMESWEPINGRYVDRKSVV